MPEPTAEDTRRAAQEGFFGHVAGLLSASAEYFKRRLELAGLEAKEAAIHYGLVLALAIAALVVVVFGYIFLCFFAIFGIAALIGGQYAWIWVTLGMALLHFGAAVGSLLYAKKMLGDPMFSATINEFRKDQQWLTPHENVN